MKVTSRSVDGPLDLLAHRPDVAWFRTGLSIVGFGYGARIDPGRGPGRFLRASEMWSELVGATTIDDDVALPGSGLVGLGSFTFDPHSFGSTLVVPAVTLGRSHGRWFVTTVDDADPARFLAAPDDRPRLGDRPRYAGASIPDLEWLAAVADVIRRIENGEVEKVVMARDVAVWSKVPFDTRVVLARLHERFLECYTYVVDGLVGASPELLLRRTGESVESEALAGSARRDPDPMEDELVGKALLASEKDRREHDAAAASVGRVLGEVCSTLERDPQPRLLRLSNVQHLATAFRGTLAGQAETLALLFRLHPTAAVGGTPTETAVELIRQLERMDRGRYAGPVGWIDAAGDGEWAIALRCAELSGARARLFAGAGIVAGSLPENELEETRLKLQAMQGVLEP